ncbi:MAG: ATP synthase gamma chain [Ignavibacteriae bacterium]|nr:MAG: ATP synthase gamma chain [Ignavibacteriota bacterium]
MATLREIRRRISGVKGTQKITKAMKMVAAAKLRKAQDAIISARPYARKIKELIQNLAVSQKDSENQYFNPAREIKNIAIVVVTSDRGLCGAFNSNILRTTLGYIKNYEDQLSPKNIHLITIGKKGYDFLLKHKYKIDYKHINIFQMLNFDIAKKIMVELTNDYLSGKYDKVEVIYNEFKSVVQQRIVIEQLLPVPPSEFVDVQVGKNHVEPNYIFEPSLVTIFKDLIPKHLNFQMWRILLESSAAEQGARMTAMDNATTNANELIRDLQLIYNKARQASITKELLEIVGGAEALK